MRCLSAIPGLQQALAPLEDLQSVAQTGIKAGGHSPSLVGGLPHAPHTHFCHRETQRLQNPWEACYTAVFLRSGKQQQASYNPR